MAETYNVISNIKPGVKPPGSEKCHTLGPAIHDTLNNRHNPWKVHIKKIINIAQNKSVVVIVRDTATKMPWNSQTDETHVFV